MIKAIIAVTLVFSSAGAWLYLDCLNKQEQGASEKIHIGIEQARAEAKKRLLTKAQLELQIKSALSSCQATAEKAKTDYQSLIQEILPRKRGQIVVPQLVTDGVAKIHASAQAECQQAYDNQMKDAQ